MPPPTRTADEWADQSRRLPAGVAEAGQWRCSRVPYVVAPLRAAQDGRYRTVVFVAASQVSKTHGVDLNLIGHRLDDDPCPIIVLFPTRDAAESQFEPKLRGMLHSTPSLWRKLAKGKAEKKTHKRVAGMDVRLAWAGSAVQLASVEAGLAIADEVDRFVPVKGEGDALTLLRARGATFPDFTLVISSSPTLGAVDTMVDPVTGREHWALSDPEDVQSLAWRSWQEGTRSEWAWPCLECGAYFVPRLRHLVWPAKATPAIARRDARLKCPVCAAELDDGCKTDLNMRAHYLAPGQTVTPEGEVIGALPDTDTASFWVSGLCSPWKTWGERAAEFVAATRSGDPGQIQAVINTGFGELFSIAGKALPWEDLLPLKLDSYKLGDVPEGVAYLVCTVDVQKYRLLHEVRGWSASGLESWLIDCGETWANGEVDRDPAMRDHLDRLLVATYGDRHVSLMLVDSGFLAEWVYAFCRDANGRARPTKGEDTGSKPLWPATQDISIGGRIMKRGMKLWHLNTDFFKSFVHTRITWPADRAGSWRMPADVPDEYLKQLVAEKKIQKPSGRGVWMQVKRENHYLDTAAMSVAAAYMLTLHMQKAPVKRPEPEVVPAALDLRPSVDVPRTAGGRRRRFRFA
jgi:phage terminase large subunit GpA-like protein